MLFSQRRNDNADKHIHRRTPRRLALLHRAHLRATCGPPHDALELRGMHAKQGCRRVPVATPGRAVSTVSAACFAHNGLHPPQYARGMQARRRREARKSVGCSTATAPLGKRYESTDARMLDAQARHGVPSCHRTTSRPRKGPSERYSISHRCQIWPSWLMVCVRPSGEIPPAQGAGPTCRTNAKQLRALLPLPPPLFLTRACAHRRPPLARRDFRAGRAFDASASQRCPSIPDPVREQWGLGQAELVEQEGEVQRAFPRALVPVRGGAVASVEVALQQHLPVIRLQRPQLRDVLQRLPIANHGVVQRGGDKGRGVGLHADVLVGAVPQHFVTSGKATSTEDPPCFGPATNLARRCLGGIWVSPGATNAKGAEVRRRAGPRRSERAPDLSTRLRHESRCMHQFSSKSGLQVRPKIPRPMHLRVQARSLRPAWTALHRHPTELRALARASDCHQVGEPNFHNSPLLSLSYRRP